MIKQERDTHRQLAGSYATIKAAAEAGFCKRKDHEYGGEEITVKGRLLVRDPKEAYSTTEWSKRGYRLRKGAQPHCLRSARIADRKKVTYAVYREDQVEPKRKVSPTPAALIDILAAVWVINRRAKRCRDLASNYHKRRAHGFAGTVKEEKTELYRLKGQAIHYLLADGQLEVVGHHRFPGGNWAEILQGSGYTFHRPCPPHGGAIVSDLDEIEAKPRGTKEPRLKDALHTVGNYLQGKSLVDVFEWPPKLKERSSRKRRYRDSDRIDGENFDHDAG
jgi:hypothetical protein